MLKLTKRLSVMCIIVFFINFFPLSYYTPFAVNLILWEKDEWMFALTSVMIIILHRYCAQYQSSWGTAVSSYCPTKLQICLNIYKTKAMNVLVNFFFQI